jgi:transaldolase
MGQLKIYLDTADLSLVKKFSKSLTISGFTSNPTIIRKQKIKDYSIFSKQFSKATNKPISLEVFADDFDLMKKEAIKLNSFGQNIYIKIPITNSKGKSSIPLIKELLLREIKINITAVFTIKQLKLIHNIVKKDNKIIISIFCGRIMDSGIYPNEISNFAKKKFGKFSNVKILWASTREVYNIIQAKKLNFDIITVPPEIFYKIKFIGYNQNKFSRDTVEMFVRDAKESKLKII